MELGLEQGVSLSMGLAMVMGVGVGVGVGWAWALVWVWVREGMIELMVGPNHLGTETFF